MKRIVCIDLNAGSIEESKSFRSVIRVFQQIGIGIDIATCEEKKEFWEREDCKIIFTLKKKSLSWPANWLEKIREQRLFWKALKQYKDEDTLILINCNLSFGFLVSAKLLGLTLVTQSSVYPSKFKFLESVKCMVGHRENIRVLLNLDSMQEKRGYALSSSPARSKKFIVLLHAKGKDYNLIFDFIALATKTPFLTYELIIDHSIVQIKSILAGTYLPDNLVVFPIQNSYHDFYRRASWIVQTSISEQKEVTGLRNNKETKDGVCPALLPKKNGHAVLDLKK